MHMDFISSNIPRKKVEMLPGRPVLEMGEGAHTGTEKDSLTLVLMS